MVLLLRTNLRQLPPAKAATGKTVCTYADTASTFELIVSDGTVFAAVDPEMADISERTGFTAGLLARVGPNSNSHPNEYRVAESCASTRKTLIRMVGIRSYSANTSISEYRLFSARKRSTRKVGIPKLEGTWVKSKYLTDNPLASNNVNWIQLALMSMKKLSALDYNWIHEEPDVLVDIRAGAAIVGIGGHNTWGNPSPGNDKVDIGVHNITR